MKNRFQNVPFKFNLRRYTEDMKNTPGMMSQMPQLPLQMDVNLAGAILPPRRMPSMPTLALTMPPPPQQQQQQPPGVKPERPASGNGKAPGKKK